jgi:hypothetical protein
VSPGAGTGGENRTGSWLKALLFLALLWFFAPISYGAWSLFGAPALPIEWVEAGLVLLITALFLRAERKDMASLGLALNRRWALHFLLGTGLGMGLITAAALAAWATGACGFQWGAPGALGRILADAWLYLAVAANEELQFRGYGLQRAVEALGRWPGQILLALLFAGVHLGNPGMSGSTRIWAVLNIFLAGLFFGLVWMRTRSLAAPMGLHFGWNWMQGSILGFGVSGGASEGLLKPFFRDRPEWLSGGPFGLEAGLPCTLLCLAAIAFTLRWRRASGENLPDTNSRP